MGGKPPLTTHKRVWSIIKAWLSCICCPPFYNIKLPVLTGILFWYERRRPAAIPILYPQHACEVDWSSTSQECQQKKTCNISWCQWCIFWYIRTVLQAVPATILWEGQQHMTIRLLPDTSHPQVRIQELLIKRVWGWSMTPNNINT